MMESVNARSATSHALAVIDGRLNINGGRPTPPTAKKPKLLDQVTSDPNTAL
jgi:hypothetical protein